MSLSGVQLHLVNSVDKAGDLMRWLSTKDHIAVDTESTGLNKRKDRARLIQVGDQMTGWAIPVDRWGGVFEEIASKYTGTYVGHNMPYDWRMLHNINIDLPKHKCHDTRLKAHVLESTGSLALKKIAAKLVDPRAAAGQELLDEAFEKNGWNWETVPVDFAPYWTYGALDPVLTMRVDDILGPRVAAEAPESYDLELAVAWVCDQMEQRGARVDREYVQKFSDEMAQFAQQSADWCMKHYHVKPGSDMAVADRLRAEGVNLTKKTGSGARFSVDKHVLGALDHPLAIAVLGYRRATKLVSTYLNNYLEMSEYDGFIHPSINTIGGTDKNPFEPGGNSRGVRTGRMSCSDPNLQNVPIRTAAGARIRNAFIPREAHDWIKTDADQIEMRILAHMSKDEGMINAFINDGDFFVNMGISLFNEPDFCKEDPRRQLIKNGGYAKIYGAGIPKFAETAGVDEDVASDFMDGFDTLFPGAKRMAKEFEQLAYQRRRDEGEAYMRSPLTGRKHVADRGKDYTLVNYIIQGTAAEVLKIKIVEADQAGLGEYMLFPVHDELDLDVPFGETDAVLETLHDVMNDDKLLTVPVTWTAAMGPRWGECKDVA